MLVTEHKDPCKTVDVVYGYGTAADDNVAKFHFLISLQIFLPVQPWQGYLRWPGKIAGHL